jgi:hypothetical protein
MRDGRSVLITRASWDGKASITTTAKKRDYVAAMRELAS